MADFKSAYNKYVGFDEIAYNCVTYLMSNNELIWKLLKYNEPDAWRKTDLTQEEKGLLIANGKYEDETHYRLFLDAGQPDSWTIETTILRIYPYDIYPQNHVVGTINVMMEVYSHWKINHLSNYKTRVDVITQQLIETFNGVGGIVGIGNLFFDRAGSQNNRVYPSGQIPFKGKAILFGNKSGA